MYWISTVTPVMGTGFMEAGVEIMYASQNQHGKNASSKTATFESLEARQLLSGHHHHQAGALKPVVIPPPVVYAPLSVTPSGSTLLITGSTGSDAITLSQSGTTFTLSNGTWKTTVTGAFSKIVIKGN